MGYKIQDVREDIHEDVEKMFETLKAEVVPSVFTNEFAETLSEDICDIVDKHIENYQFGKHELVHIRTRPQGEK